MSRWSIIAADSSETVTARSIAESAEPKSVCPPELLVARQIQAQPIVRAVTCVSRPDTAKVAETESSFRLPNGTERDKKI